VTKASGFFYSVNGDRKYKPEFFSELFGAFIHNGVFPKPSSNFQVFADTEDMRIKIRRGKAWINGYFIYTDTEEVLTVEPADGVMSRIDRVVVRLNVPNRVIDFGIVKGDYATNPVGKALVRDAEIWELCLAEVSVKKGAIKITQADIADMRGDGNVCGFVHQMIDHVDTTTLFNQYQAQFQEKSQANEEEFNSWFAGIQSVLEGDVAANLSSEIQAVSGKVENMKSYLLEGTGFVASNFDEENQMYLHVEYKNKLGEVIGNSEVTATSPNLEITETVSFDGLSVQNVYTYMLDEDDRPIEVVVV